MDRIDAMESNAEVSEAQDAISPPQHSSESAAFMWTPRPELVIGIVSTAGVDLDPICESFKHAMDSVAHYSTEVVRVSEIIEQFAIDVDNEGIADCNRWRRLMNAGDRIRRITGENSICVMLAIMKIQKVREDITGSDEAFRQNGATILRQIKHPDEIELLREIYGSRAVIVGVSDDPTVREEALRRQLRDPVGGRVSAAAAAAEAVELLQRDENDEYVKYGQHVRDAFALCDAYLPARHRPTLDDAVQRLVKLLFGSPFITPTRDEMGVWYAYAAKHRSSASGRQVGAVIFDHDGEVLATGCNDVPAPRGGQNWDGEDQFDHRDYTLGHESNDRHRLKMTEELLGVLKSSSWLSEEHSVKSSNELATLALGGDNSGPGILKGRRVASLLEFGRIMHAEMAAITTAARRGTPIRGGTLYTTTYPCHECMRLIIGAGVERVVYVDPYPKSLVTELFEHHLGVSEDKNPRVALQPFLGVAPRLIGRVFDQAAGRVRDVSGTFERWDGRDAAYAGEVDRFVDSVLFRELGIADMLLQTYLPLLERQQES